jgi:protein-tyrosine phosphatase
MAEAMLRHELRARGRHDADVASAGTWAVDGNAASEGAARVLAERAIDLSGHSARSVTSRQLVRADLIVAMTKVHREELEQIAPETATKTLLLKEIGELAPSVRGGGVAGLLAAPRPAYRRALDVDDPMGFGDLAYRRCLADLEPGIAALADILCAG